MCIRQWVGFTDCNDIRIPEHRCRRNSIDMPVECCANHQLDPETRKNCEALGVFIHPDPPIAIFPGRCDGWVGSADDEKEWGASGIYDLRITEPTWIMCSNDWHDAVGITDRDRPFEVWENGDERRMRYTGQDQDTAPPMVAFEDLQNGLLGNGSIPVSQKTSKIERIATTEINIIGSLSSNPASNDAASKRVTAEGRKSNRKNSGDNCPVEHSRKNKRLKIKFPNTAIKDSGGREENEDPTGISDEKY